MTDNNTNNDFLKLLTSLEKSKTNFYPDTQKLLLYFVSEYNGKLTYNTDYFKRIINLITDDLKNTKNKNLLLDWLKTYTNFIGISKDLKIIKTSEYIFKNGDKKYILSFNDFFEGQKWYEKIEKQTTKKEKTEKEKLLASVKNLLKNIDDLTDESNFTLLSSYINIENLNRLKTTLEK